MSKNNNNNNNNLNKSLNFTNNNNINDFNFYFTYREKNNIKKSILNDMDCHNIKSFERLKNEISNSFNLDNSNVLYNKDDNNSLSLRNTNKFSKSTLNNKEENISIFDDPVNIVNTSRLKINKVLNDINNNNINKCNNCTNNYVCNLAVQNNINNSITNFSLCYNPKTKKVNNAYIQTDIHRNTFDNIAITKNISLNITNRYNLLSNNESNSNSLNSNFTTMLKSCKYKLNILTKNKCNKIIEAFINM